MFGRDDNPSSGLPGAGASGLGGLSPAGGVALGKSAPPTAAVPVAAREWEAGPLGLVAFLIVALAAATYGFAADRHHRQFDPADMAERGAITASSPLSFTEPARFAKAVTLIRAKAPAGARVRMLTVSPTEVHGSVIASDGEDLYVAVDPSLKVVLRHTGMGGTGDGVAFSQIPSGAPHRIVNAARAKFGVDPKNLESMYVSGSGIHQSIGAWSITYSRPFANNRLEAAIDGTDVRRVGEPDAMAREQLRAGERRIAEAKAAARTALQKAQR